MSRTFSAKIPIFPLLFQAKQRFGRKYRGTKFRQDISADFETFGTLYAKRLPYASSPLVSRPVLLDILYNIVTPAGMVSCGCLSIFLLSQNRYIRHADSIYRFAIRYDINPARPAGHIERLRISKAKPISKILQRIYIE